MIVNDQSKERRMPLVTRERINTPISTGELDRRRTAIRAGMREAGIDVLLAHNNNDHLGGNVRYLVDVPAVHGYALSVVLPRHDEITIVRHGPFGGDDPVEDDDPVLHGVRRVLTTPMFASALYCREYEAQLLVSALAPYATGRIGLVGTYQLSAAILDHLRAELPDAEFIEASEIVDAVRMVKSAEEWELIDATARLQDAAVDAAFAAVEPGKRDRDITAAVQRFIMEGGGEQGLYLCASMPIGEPTLFQHRHYQNRVIREGDYLALLVETNGPGGLWTELGRSCVLGSATAEMSEELDFVLRARRFCVEAMRPGVPAAEVFERYNAFMREHGRPTESRLHCHNQGYDLVERPLIRSDETATIEVDMNIACHPMYLGGGVFSTICDNYRIGVDGNERLHRYPEKIVEL
jgi:Xaa-Pro aminopeptidase